VSTLGPQQFSVRLACSDRLEPMKPWRIVEVEGTELEVSDWGSGEPIIFVQTALTADELLPLADEPVFEHGYRKVVYHRRGYAGSGQVEASRSIPQDATDCRALLKTLGLASAHIVGASYSGAVGMQLAAEAPECVHTLTLLEPPPVHTPSAPEFRAANERLVRSRHELGPAAALDEFLTMVVGPHWRQVVESLLPGSAAQMERDLVTFFDFDLPALLDWRFGPADARRISCPALHIGGSESGPWFAEVRELVLSWLPHAEDVVIDGAGHSLALTGSTTSVAVRSRARFATSRTTRAVQSASLSTASTWPSRVAQPESPMTRGCSGWRHCSPRGDGPRRSPMGASPMSTALRVRGRRPGTSTR
jgi:pimeloyl-ACP methyl ester carboxylesterase